MIVEKM